MQPCRYLILVINMFLDKGDLVRIHNLGNFGDLVHAHNLLILQAGQVAAFGQLFSEAVCAGQSAVQTQHPAPDLYFQLGTEYVIIRCTLTSRECIIIRQYQDCQVTLHLIPWL